jgi:hypothetical protein
MILARSQDVAPSFRDHAANLHLFYAVHIDARRKDLHLAISKKPATHSAQMSTHYS